MKLCFTELMVELSHALDYVETEVVGVQTNHSKRVAYICTALGKHMGLDAEQLSDLAVCAVLHDNALTEYVQSEYLSTGTRVEKTERSRTGIHCSMGERNIKGFPFLGNVDGAILYHHEEADGSGPFGKVAGEIPLYAELIHLADQVDSEFGLGKNGAERFGAVMEWVKGQEGRKFSVSMSELFRESMVPEVFEELSDERIKMALEKMLVCVNADFTPEQLMHISGIIARIVDYKSTFTSLHSMGIAHRAYEMAAWYKMGEEERAKLFLAGALHDIGKLAVTVNILEKPGKLTDEEFEVMKSHASITYEILNRIDGMEDICRWASLHHEKLNGRGYPFGYDGTQLGFHERLMACLDIYQALREDRPYKKGKSHEATMEIMEDMAENGFIDADITEDLNRVFK